MSSGGGVMIVVLPVGAASSSTPITNGVGVTPSSRWAPAIASANPAALW